LLLTDACNRTQGLSHSSRSTEFTVADTQFRGILKDMSKVRKLLHTRYRVNDLEQTVKFYQEVLGLEAVRRHKSPRGSELVFLKTPGSEELIELCCFPAGGPVQV